MAAAPVALVLAVPVAFAPAVCWIDAVVAVWSMAEVPVALALAVAVWISADVAVWFTAVVSVARAPVVAVWFAAPVAV